MIIIYIKIVSKNFVIKVIREVICSWIDGKVKKYMWINLMEVLSLNIMNWLYN